MKNTIILSCILILLCTTGLVAQQEKPDFGIDFSGFVKTDVMYDSRQTVSLREGHFLIFPSAELLDSNKTDVNDKANFNILSIQTRLNGKIFGPEAFSAKTSGMIEAEFFGTSEGDINGFRLRHAYGKMDWENTSLLIGQTWHPMFITEVFPGVVSFNTGAPFQPFSRNPQIRFTQAFSDVKVMVAAISQRDFQSYGPDAANRSVQSTSYLRNSGIPNFDVQLQYKYDAHIFGAGIDYKYLTPRLVTSKNYQTNEGIGSIAAMGYMKLDLAPITLKAEGIYGENLGDMTMLGGYAAKSVDSQTGIETFTPIGCYSLWTELVYGKELEYGFFAGYTKNLGAKDNIVGAYYSRGNTIDNLFRIAPRVQWNSGKARFSTELEYTSAAYGTPNNMDKGKVENTTTAANLRLLLAAYLFF